MLDDAGTDGRSLYLRCMKALPITELESMAVAFGVTVEVAVMFWRFLRTRYLSMPVPQVYSAEP